MGTEFREWSENSGLNMHTEFVGRSTKGRQDGRVDGGAYLQVDESDI